MMTQSREAARLAAVTQLFAASRGLPVPYARADVEEVLRAAAEWDAAQDAPTVRDMADLLAGHSVKPSGVCTCGAVVNDGKAKGLDRAATLNRHRAMVLHAAGYRWAPEQEWEWAAVGPREWAKDVDNFSWGTEESARALYARLCGPVKARTTTGPVSLVRRTPAGLLEEVETWPSK